MRTGRHKTPKGTRHLAVRLGVAAPLVLALALGSAYAQPLRAPAKSETKAEAKSTTKGPVDVRGEMTIVTGLVNGGPSDGARADANLRIVGSAATLVGTGLELGAAASLRADGDATARTTVGGRYSSIAAGGPRGTPADGGDVFLEGAYLFARGGFGAVHVGRDKGVASRLAVTSPTIFRAVGVNDWHTDFTGLNDVHTVNDFSGLASKVTYMAPPGFLGGLLGQLQVGLSYAPEIKSCVDDGCAPLGGFAIAPSGGLASADQSWRDVIEAALYYQKGLDVGAAKPMTVGVSASYVQAEDDTRSLPVVPLLGDYRAIAVGLNLALGRMTVGGSVKSTNTGPDQARSEDYLAFDAGVTYDAGEWNFMLGYGAAEADVDAALLLGPLGPYRLNRETQTAQAGISFAFDHGVTLGAAAQYIDSLKADVLGGDENAAAVVFESSIKF